MNLNDLTIGAVRELAALLPGLFAPTPPTPPTATGPTSAPSPVAFPAGTPVMIRDHLAGLLVGRLAADYRLGEVGWALAPGARKIHYWSKAAGPEGAALCGPGPGSRVCPAASLPRAGVNLVEIVGLTDDEIAAVLASPVWRP